MFIAQNLSKKKDTYTARDQNYILPDIKNATLLLIVKRHQFCYILRNS